MSDLSWRDVEAAKAAGGAAPAQDYYPRQTIVATPPPGYFSGFRIGIQDEGHVVIGPGVVELASHLVISNAEHILEAGEWECTRMANSTYYIYLDANSQFHVSVEVPTWSTDYHSYYHPRLTYRYIGKIITATGSVEAAYVMNMGAAALEDVDKEAVNSLQLVDLAVLTAKLNDLAVTTAKLDDEAVTTDKILARTIVAGDIAAGTITTFEIAANTIVAANIAADTITANEIAAGAITALIAEVYEHLTISATGGWIAGVYAEPSIGDERLYIDRDEMVFQRHNGLGWIDRIRLGNVDGDGDDWKSKFEEQIIVVGTDGPSGASLVGTSDGFEIVIDNAGDNGISIFSSNTSIGMLAFGDSDAGLKGWLSYSHTSDILQLQSSGNMYIYGGTAAATILVKGILSPDAGEDLGTPAYTFADGYINRIRAGAGTAANPSIIGTSDITTGMWFPAASTVALSVGGAEIMRANATGIGIGSASPDVLLHIAKTNATAVLRLERNDTTVGTDDIVARIEAETQDTDNAGVCAKIEAISEDTIGGTGWRFSTGTASALVEAMRIDQYGNVGIHVTDPAEALEIETNMTSTCLQISNSAADGDPYLAFALSGTKKFSIGVDDGDSDKLKIGTTAIGTSTIMTILPTGEVGLGVSPTELFHIYSATDATMKIQAASGNLATIQLLESGAGDVGAYVLYDGNTNYFQIWAGNNPPLERMCISRDTGNVGIGIAAPAAKLHIDQASDTAAIPVLYLDQADISEEMIEFNTTIGVGNAIEAIGAKTLSTTHFIKVTIPGGLTRYLPVGTIA